MIEISVKSHQGEGGLKSMCSVVKSLEKQSDCYKVFVIDDCNSILCNNEFYNCNVIANVCEETLFSVLNAKGKIILIKNDVIFAEASDLYIKTKKLLGILENNACQKIYLIYKDIVIN